MAALLSPVKGVFGALFGGKDTGDDAGDDTSAVHVASTAAASRSHSSQHASTISTSNPPLALTASPGLITLLDVALFEAHEGEMTSTICTSNNVLMTLFELKRHCSRLVKEIALHGKTYDTAAASPGDGGHNTNTNTNTNTNDKELAQAHALADLAMSFATACLDGTNEAICKMVVEPLAETANLVETSSSEDSPSEEEGGSGPGGGSTSASGGVSGAASGGSGKSSSKSKGSGGAAAAAALSNQGSFRIDTSAGGEGGTSAIGGSGGGGGVGGDSAGASSLSFGVPLERRKYQPRRRDCWESQRLYCPDFVWADDVICFIQRLMRSLVRHRFVNVHCGESSSNSNAGNGESGVRLPSSVADAVNIVLLLLRHDLPAKLYQFRVAAEADGVVIKRLYLVKCEYRAPFRAFLEAHQSVQKAPSIALVDACLALHQSNSKEGLHRRTQATERAVQDALHHPTLIEALELERRIEEVEIGMARMLLPFTDLARYMENRKAHFRVVPGVVEAGELPALEELIRRLRPLLCRKAGSELRTGIRPLLLDLQGIARDTGPSSSDTSPFGIYRFKSSAEATRLRLESLLSQLQKLVDLCSMKEGLTITSGSNVPQSIIRGLAMIDAELFTAQHGDWMEMVLEQRKLEASSEPSFAELSETIQRAEIDAGVTAAPRKQLNMLRERLDFLEKDRVKRFEVLQEMVGEVCMRELNMEIELTAPDQDDILELPPMSPLGVFGLQLQIAREPLPLG